MRTGYFETRPCSMTDPLRRLTFGEKPFTRSFIMNNVKDFSVFVIQAGASPKDVYVGHSQESPSTILTRYSSKTPTPKKLRKQDHLILRPDLYELYPPLPTQEKALFYEKLLAEKLQKQGYNILSKSLQKKLKNNNRKSRSSQKPLSIRRIDYRDEEATKDNKGDVFAYGRKKSQEWNDELAIKFQESLTKKIQDKKLGEDK